MLKWMGALGLGAAGALVATDHSKHTLPPSDAAAEDRFRQAQQALFTSVGLRATAAMLDVREPPLRAQVIEAGAGEPVVFVHGGNSVAAGWAPLLARLQDHFHLYAPDRPGCGLTGRFLYGGVDLRQHGAAFLASTLDALGLARASLVGNSMGGFFALAFALAHPERVNKLALLGEPAGSAQTPSLFHRLVGTRGINSLLYATALRPRGTAESTRTSWARAHLVAHPERASRELLDCAAAGAVLPGAVESWITMVERAIHPAGAALFGGESRVTRTLRPELPRLTAPTLFIWGDQDPFGPPTLGQEMASLMPNARCEVIRDAGHLPWIDEPDRCAELVRAHFG